MDSENNKESSTDDLLEKDTEIETEVEKKASSEEDIPEFGPIKRPSTPIKSGSNLDLGQTVGVRQPLKTKSNTKTIILIVLLLIVVIGGGYFIIKSRGSFGKPTPSPTPTPTSAPTPTESPKPELNKLDWSFEVLNGSGQTGLAKKIGDQIKELGYEVTKTGNADNSNFQKTQIFVKSDLVDKIELVIADLKDIIKIASYGGELKDSTASARIIIGKDSI